MNGSLRHNCFAIVITLLTLTACSSVEVTTDYALEQDFSSYQRYAWHPDGIKQTAALEAMGGSIFDRRLRQVITDTLGTRGMTISDQPDFYINFNVITEERVSVNTYHSYGGYGPGWGYYPSYYYSPYYGGMGSQTSVYYYTQGTLIIDIIDVQSNQLVWRATADGPVESQSTPEKRVQSLRKLADKMFRDFPPEAP